MASSRLAGDVGLRHDGRDPESCERHAAPKKVPTGHETKDRKALSSLIRWSIQEIRRIAIRLAQQRIKPAHIIAWSLWRRAHQATAQQAHLKQKLQL
jgi:hypothetical protein